MKNRTYKTIVFDLGNVLIPFDHNIWIERFNSIEEGLGDKYYQNFTSQQNLLKTYESGKMSDDEFIAINLNWVDHKINENQFVDIYSNIFKLNTDVIELLPILKKKYNIVLLSNTSHIHKKFGWGDYPFLEYFDKLVLSYEVQAVKPDKLIYKAAEGFTQELPETHIFIDDIREYVNAAKQLGWDGIHFTGYDNLIEGFKSRNIL